MTHLAVLIGLFIAAFGIVGIVTSGLFVKTVEFFLTSPMIYVAAVIRVAFGVVLILASKRSRAPVALRILGILITIGGVLTPLIVSYARSIVEWWQASGSGMVRIWATIAFLIGVFILYAAFPKREKKPMGF